MNVRRTVATVTVTAAAFSGVTLLAPAAEASGGGGARVIKTGSCSGSANWKLARRSTTTAASRSSSRWTATGPVSPGRCGSPTTAARSSRVAAPRTAAADRSPSGCVPPTGPALTPSTHAPHTPGRPAREPCASDRGPTATPVAWTPVEQTPPEDRRGLLLRGASISGRGDRRLPGCGSLSRHHRAGRRCRSRRQHVGSAASEDQVAAAPSGLPARSALSSDLRPCRHLTSRRQDRVIRTPQGAEP